MNRAGQGGGASVRGVTSVVGQSGQEIDLTETPLVYGNDDAYINPNARKAVEEQEAKRTKFKSEYALAFDRDGNPLGPEQHGGSGSVNIPLSWTLKNGATVTHNHPRGKGEEGLLGGTFSYGDLNHFATGRYQTMRASASEGTYSITKMAAFDSSGFANYARQTAAAAMAAHTARHTKLYMEAMSDKISYNKYTTENAKSFNKAMVEIHNGLLQGQSQYGYKYTLEGKKNG